jgi:hypothetical protein
MVEHGYLCDYNQTLDENATTHVTFSGRSDHPRLNASIAKKVRSKIIQIKQITIQKAMSNVDNKADGAERMKHNRKT